VGYNELSCNAEALPERLHLDVGHEFSAPDLFQTVVDRRALGIGQDVATGTPRLDLGRGLRKLLLVFLRPGSGLFQQFFKSKAHGQNIAYFDFAAIPRSDLRDPKVDAVDWVELIPFSETRNYLQRIMENLQVYRARFGGGTRLQIEADLHRGASVE
jgi:hypothetical protein